MVARSSLFIGGNVRTGGEPVRVPAAQLISDPYCDRTVMDNRFPSVKTFKSSAAAVEAWKRVRSYPHVPHGIGTSSRASCLRSVAQQLDLKRPRQRGCAGPAGTSIFLFSEIIGKSANPPQNMFKRVHRDSSQLA